MDAESDLTAEATRSPPPTLAALAEEVARALTFSRVRGRSAYVGTGVSYPNGTGVVVRLDVDAAGYTVSDEAYASFVADTMTGSAQFLKAAAQVAKRAGVSFDRRTLFVSGVPRSRLPGTVLSVANASARSVERTSYMLDRLRIERSKDIFGERMRAAFGDSARFRVPVHGATGRPYEFDGGAFGPRDTLRALFEFVAPTFSAVAAANLKIGDARAIAVAPIIVALADYDRTDASLRSILSATASAVIPAAEMPDMYRQLAA